MTIIIGIICFVIGFIIGIALASGIVPLRIIPKIATLIKPKEQTLLEITNYEEEVIDD